MTMRCAGIGIVSLWAMCGTLAFAGPLARLGSHAMGDGWFEYHVTMFQDQYFTTQQLSECAMSFTNRSSYGTVPEDWSITNLSDHWAGWWYDPQQPQTMPYDALFTVQSAETNWAVTTNFLLVGLLWPKAIPNHPCHEIFSVNWAFFMKLAALTPVVSSPSSHALNSPTRLDAPASMTVEVEVIPDIALTALSPDTVRLDWYTNGTIRMQRSTDMVAWEEVDLIHTTPSTLWTSPVPGAVACEAFRADLVAFGHVDKRAPQPFSANSGVRLSYVRPLTQDSLSLGFESVPDATYVVVGWFRGGEERTLAQVTAHDSKTDVVVDMQGLPTWGGLSVRRLNSR